MGRIHNLLLIVAWLCSSVTWARTISSVPESAAPLRLELDWAKPQMAKEVGLVLLTTGGEVDRTAVGHLIGDLQRRRHEVQANVARNEKMLKGKDDDKVAKKIRNNKTLFFYDLLLKWTNQLNQDPDLSFAAKAKLVRNIIDLDLALKSDVAADNTIAEKLRHLQEFSQRFEINKTAAPLGEAINLVNPATGEYFTQAELARLKSEGVDLSTFDPPTHNGVIEITGDVSQNSPQRRFAAGENRLHRGVEVVFPAKNEVTFKEVRNRQSRPKLTVIGEGPDGKMREYKLKLSMELHGEPTAAALSNALGIYSDLSRYVRRVKVHLGDTSFKKFKTEWSSYYKDENLERLILEQGSDNQGEFLVFMDGLLEPELDEEQLMRPGPWYWGGADHQYRREFRGLSIFNLWIHNTDLKEGENNKLILKARPGGEFDTYYVQQDLGFVLGHYFRERPTDFAWTLVKEDGRDAVTFNYRNFQPNSGFRHVTWADARWMARKIGQLTRQQIVEAVKFGNWPNQAPYDYQSLYVEKLIERRNQLVKAFQLVGEQLPSGGRLELLPVDRAVEQRAVPSEKHGVPGYSVDFSPEVKSMVTDPLMEKIQRGLKSGAINLIGAVNSISLEPDWFGWDDGVIARVILNVNRTIVKNPSPKSYADAYIVRDDFKIGARLGYGMVISGDVAYVRGYSLIYPAATRAEAMDRPRYLLQILGSSYSQAQAQLPPGHILIHESYLEGRGRLNIDGGPISIGYEASLSRFDLTRSLISRRHQDRIVLVEDESLYTEMAQRIYTKLLLLKITHFKWSDQNGQVNRDAYELPVDKGSLIDEVIFANDFSGVKEKAQRRKLKSDFWQQVTEINLLGFWKKKKIIRRDLIEVATQDESGQWVQGRTKLVVDVGAEQNWRLVLDGEDHIKRVHFSSDMSGSQFADPLLRISFTHHDRNATVDEFENGYISFIDGLAGMLNFLDFSPRLHAKREGYGEILVNTEIEYYRDGIETLLQLDPESFRRTLTSQVQQVQRFPKGEADEEQQLFYGKWYPTPEMNEPVDRFLRYMEDVRRAPDLTSQIESLSLALYKAATTSGDSFHPAVFRVLNSLVGESNLFMESHISVPEDVENKFPGRVTFYNQLGKQRKFSRERERLLFDLSEALAVYQAF